MLKTKHGDLEFWPKHNGYILKPLLVCLLKKKSLYMTFESATVC